MKQANIERFLTTCSRVGVPECSALMIWEDLEARYTGGQRFYHDLTHIDKMLGWFDTVGAIDDAMELAIWFHDIIYEPLERDNESQSMKCFENHLGEYLDVETINNVERFIMATDPSLERSGNADEDLMSDIDLSILGSSPEEYVEYSVAIRKEYSMVPDADFNAGRSAVLQNFLANRIYVTEHFADLEDLARNNMVAELDLLAQNHG